MVSPLESVDMKAFLRKGILVVPAFLLFLYAFCVLPSMAHAEVVVATVDGEITAGTVPYVERALRQAEDASAELFLLELNTPGGLLKSTEELSRLFIDSEVPTAVFVYKDTGWAFSAGVFILLSADIAGSHPTASIGAATPITGDGEDAGEKITNASAQWLATLASRSNRDSELVRSFVTEASTLSGQEAFDTGLIDVLATSTEGFLAERGLSESVIMRVAPNTGDAILSFFSLPYLVPLLLSLGALGLFFTFRTGEIDTIGIAGVLLLLLGLWGMGAITMSMLGVVLLIVGMTLLAVELFFTPGFGVVGGVGVVALLISMVTFANEPLFPSYFTSTLFYMVLGVWVAVGIIMLVMGKLSLTAQLKPIAVGREALYGKVVPVEIALAPAGRVMVDGESYVAKTATGIVVPKGTDVRIVQIEGNTILVEPINE